MKEENKPRSNQAAPKGQTIQNPNSKTNQHCYPTEFCQTSGSK
jgi:hypothetical protein